MRKWVFISVAVAAVIVVGYLLGFFTSSSIEVDTVTVRSGEIHEYVVERGKTRLEQIYQVTMPESGRIEVIALIEGQPVAQGDIVAQMVPRDLELAYDAAKALVNRLDQSIIENDDTSVEAIIVKQTQEYVKSMDKTVKAASKQVEAQQERSGFAKDNYSRVLELYEEGASTDDERDRAKLLKITSNIEHRQTQLVYEALKALQTATTLLPSVVQNIIKRKELTRNVLIAQRAEALANLELAEQRKKRGVMKSPVDGIVLERHVSNERFVPAGAVLLTIGRFEDLEVEIDVLSLDAVHVKPGAQVDLFGPAIGEPAARGRVARVFPAGFTKVSSLGVEQQRVKVIVHFDPEDLKRLSQRKLGFDYRVNVRIETARKPGVLIIERSTLFRGRGEDAPWQVFLVRDGKVQSQSVKVGLMNDRLVEITEGLSEGDQVVKLPPTTLTDGSRVTDKPKPTKGN